MISKQKTRKPPFLLSQNLRDEADNHPGLQRKVLSKSPREGGGKEGKYKGGKKENQKDSGLSLKKPSKHYLS